MLLSGAALRSTQPGPKLSFCVLGSCSLFVSVVTRFFRFLIFVLLILASGALLNVTNSVVAPIFAYTGLPGIYEDRM